MTTLDEYEDLIGVRFEDKSLKNNFDTPQKDVKKRGKSECIDFSNKKGKLESFSRGNYKIGISIAHGAFGDVRLARHKDSNDEVIIKIIEKSLLAKAENEYKVNGIPIKSGQELINNEIEILKNVDHKNIVKLIEIFESKSSYYLVLEYCQQKDLFEKLENEGKFQEETAKYILYQLADAMNYIHSMKIAHRDLKLENILLDSQGNAKLTDFGLSAKYDNKFLSTSCGTMSYACPEKLKGENYNPEKSDVWSLGIVFYTLLHGFLPYNSEDLSSLVEIEKKIIHYDENLSSESIDLIKKMLEVNSEKRINFKGILANSYLSNYQDPININSEDKFYKQNIINESIKIMFSNDISKLKNKEEVDNFFNTKKDIIISSLVQNKYDSISAVYRLLNLKHENEMKEKINILKDLNKDNNNVDLNIIEKKNSIDSIKAIRNQIKACKNLNKSKTHNLTINTNNTVFDLIEKVKKDDICNDKILLTSNNENDIDQDFENKKNNVKIPKKKEYEINTFDKNQNNETHQNSEIKDDSNHNNIKDSNFINQNINQNNNQELNLSKQKENDNDIIKIVCDNVDNNEDRKLSTILNSNSNSNSNITTDKNFSKINKTHFSNNHKSNAIATKSNQYHVKVKTLSVNFNSYSSKPKNQSGINNMLMKKSQLKIISMKQKNFSQDYNSNITTNKVNNKIFIKENLILKFNMVDKEENINASRKIIKKINNNLMSKNDIYNSSNTNSSKTVSDTIGIANFSLPLDLHQIFSFKSSIIAIKKIESSLKQLKISYKKETIDNTTIHKFLHKFKSLVVENKSIISIYSLFISSILLSLALIKTDIEEIYLVVANFNSLKDVAHSVRDCLIKFYQSLSSCDSEGNKS